MPTVTAQLNTTGMHCGSCSMLIDMTVGDLAGIESVKSDHASGTTVVSYDSDTVSLDDVIAAIRSIGYEAEPAA